MANQEYTPDRERTAIALAFRPEGFIADQVLPRVQVTKSQFIYTKFESKGLNVIPETQIGNHSEANLVDFNKENVDAHVEAHGLRTRVSDAEDRDAAPGQKPSDFGVMDLTGLIHLRREKSVADRVFSGATYNGNSTAITGTAQWNNPDTSDPLRDLRAARDACARKPQKLVIGQAVWSILSSHPKLVLALRGITDQGVLTREDLARLLEIREILVGETTRDAAPKGKPTQNVNLWGKHAAFIHTSQNPTLKGGSPSFGLTASLGGMTVGQARVELSLERPAFLPRILDLGIADGKAEIVLSFESVASENDAAGEIETVEALAAVLGEESAQVCVTTERVYLDGIGERTQGYVEIADREGFMAALERFVAGR